MSKGYKNDPTAVFKATAQGQGSAQPGSNPVVTWLRDTFNLLKAGIKVFLPAHLYIPEDAQSLDMRNLFDVDPAATVRIIDFTAPDGATTVIQSYGVFNDGLLAADFDFIPRVNGRRVYVYQGDPLDNFRIYLGVAPDLSNTSLIVGTLYLQPGDRLTWDAINRSAVATTMGVRVVGYVDRSQTRKQTRTGG